MEENFQKTYFKQNACVLINQINGEIEYIEHYLSKLKEKVNELEAIIKNF